MAGRLLQRTVQKQLAHTYIHTYIFINPRSHMTIQDAKTVSDEIEKGGKEKLINKIIT